MSQVPIPDHMDIYHLHEEAQPSDRTALQAVVDHIVAEVCVLALGVVLVLFGRLRVRTGV